MKRKKYTYIPKDEIESITTWSGKNITQEKILDGAYVRGNVKYAKGGMAHGGNIPVSELKQGYYMFGNKGNVWNNTAHIAKSGNSTTLCDTPMLSTNWCKIEGVKEIGCPKCIEIYNSMEMADGGMMAHGGETHDSQDFEDFIYENHQEIDVHSPEFQEFMLEHYENMLSHQKNLINLKKWYSSEYAHGGETENYLYSVWVDGGEYNDSYLKSLEDAIDLAKNLENEDYENIVIERLNLDKSHNKWIENWESDDEYEDGGETEGIYTKSVEEQAQEMLGSRFYELNPQEREDIINSFIADGVITPRVTYTQFEEEDFEYADGGGVATASYKVTYQMAGSKDKKEKLFTDKSKAEFFVETMEEDEDVKSVKLEELKPEKPAKAEKVKAEPTIDIFGAAKKVTTTAASKTKKPTVEIDGIGDDIERYNELKAIMDNAKAETELIGGRIKEAGLEKYIEMYEQTGRNPPNFDILSGGNSILFMIKDAYIKNISPELRQMLEEYGDGLIEVTNTYSFDTEILDKEVKGNKTIGDIIKELIGKSADIPQEDKMKLLKVKEEVKIPKGTIDRLADYGDNIQEIFNLIQPQLALK